jgi:hypothetical protein
VSQSQPERSAEPLDEPPVEEAYEAWRDLQDVLEERDREYWAEAHAEE